MHQFPVLITQEYPTFVGVAAFSCSRSLDEVHNIGGDNACRADMMKKQIVMPAHLMNDLEHPEKNAGRKLFADFSDVAQRLEVRLHPCLPVRGLFESYQTASLCRPAQMSRVCDMHATDDYAHHYKSFYRVAGNRKTQLKGGSGRCSAQIVSPSDRLIFSLS